MRVLAGVLMIHHGSEGGLGPANFGTGGEGSPAAPVPGFRPRHHDLYP